MEISCTGAESRDWWGSNRSNDWRQDEGGAEGPTQESKMVDEATSNNLALGRAHPNWGLNLRIRALLNGDEFSGPEVVHERQLLCTCQFIYLLNRPSCLYKQK